MKTEEAGLPLWAKELLVPFVAWCAIVLITELTPVDVVVSDWFYDRAREEWPLKDAWYMEWLHEGGRAIVFLAGLGALLAALASIWKPRLRESWRACVYFVVCLGGAGALIGFLKHHSERPCPYKTDRYGGLTPHLGLFEHLPPGVADGKCFPAAHAAGAFALFALYFIHRDRDPARARRGLWLALFLGNLYGVIQIARGQHFLSHHLWSAVIVWYLCLAVYRLVFRGRLWPSAAASA
ncbi:MAG TPA: phosphatase PAP2 family protein [Planctomycetota bacterium]|nr:phosphatase PAP2 family protein [Planctomycetota bacterium]